MLCGIEIDNMRETEREREREQKKKKKKKPRRLRAQKQVEKRWKWTIDWRVVGYINAETERQACKCVSRAAVIRFFFSL
jgi:hypothetical protein